MSKKKTVGVIPDATIVEVNEADIALDESDVAEIKDVEGVPEATEEIAPIDIEGDVKAFIANGGIVQASAINVPHNQSDIDAVLKHLKGTGQLNGDGSGRVWLA